MASKAARRRRRRVIQGQAKRETNASSTVEVGFRPSGRACGWTTATNNAAWYRTHKDVPATTAAYQTRRR